MSVYDTYDFVVTPSSSKQQLWESTGEGRGVRPVRYTYENLKVEVFTRGGEKVGVVMGSASFKEGQRERLRDSTCEQDFSRLAARHPELRGDLVVTGSFLEESVRGKGVGVAMYRVLAEHAGKQGLAVVPEYCWSGTPLTSDDALRVWGKLGREAGLDAEGHVVYMPPARENPRKKRVEPVLDPRHLALIETPAFKRWFRDSKVVDRLGRPLVVYHGSPDIRDVFGGMTTIRAPSAFFATDSYAVAGTYARGKPALDYQNSEPGIVPLFVSIQNPMVIDAQGARWRKTEHYIAQAYRDGHDGIIIKNSVDDYMGTGGAGLATVYVWFDPRQAKSAVLDEVRSWVDRKPLTFATPNAGTFDPEDTDMRKNPDPPYREPTPAEVKRDEAARRLAAIIQHWNAWYAERIAETPSSERYLVYNYIYLPKVWTDLLLWLMGSDDVLGKHEKYLFLLDQPNRKNKQTYPPTPPFTPLQERRSTKLAFPASSFTYIGRQFGMGGTVEDMPEANDALREFSETWQAFDGGSRIKTVAGRTSCSRCGGSGKLREYSHVEGGVCFKCGGSGRSGGG